MCVTSMVTQQVLAEIPTLKKQNTCPFDRLGPEPNAPSFLFADILWAE